MFRKMLDGVGDLVSEDAETRAMTAELAAKMGEYANFVFALAVLLPCGDLPKVADALTNVYQTGRFEAIALFWGGLGMRILLAGIVWLMYVRTSEIAKRRRARFNAVAGVGLIAILLGDVAFFAVPILPYANPTYRELNATGFAFYGAYALILMIAALSAKPKEFEVGDYHDHVVYGNLSHVGLVAGACLCVSIALFRNSTPMWAAFALLIILSGWAPSVVRKTILRRQQARSAHEPCDASRMVPPTIDDPNGGAERAVHAVAVEPAK